MKKRIFFFILVITIFFPINAAIQTVEQPKVNYALLKNEYINNHPGQIIIPFPWNPTTSIKVLPFNYEIPAAPANNFSTTACRNQFESASFIITAQKDISGIGINVADLYNDQGDRIPSDTINVRLVKVWYQLDTGGYDMGSATETYNLTPELLLKDDTLVNVDYVNKTNYLKVTINGTEQYIDISNPNATFPINAQIHDTLSLQPFSLKEKENKQIWLTIHVPADTHAGDYHGNITITALSEIPIIMNFSVTVLPFDLEPPPIEYALFYRGIIPSTPKEGINSEYKTPQQYALELQNMKDHGVSYPTMYQGNDQMLRTALSLRNQSGLPNDHIYLGNFGTGNQSNQPDLTALKNEVKGWKNTLSQYGYDDVYIYGMDEARGGVLLSERPAWDAVHQTGAKMFVAVGDNLNAVDIVGDILDVAILANYLNTTQAAKWHSYGQKIFSYANPQAGIENPKIYRENYGFALWNAGYDGTINYAYQHGFGPSIWNDNDRRTKDHVFAYPTSNGVIDTIQWEGWREGVDDTRYLATIIKKEGSDTTGRAIITDSLSKGEEMSTIRKKVIEQILISQIQEVPDPSATQTQTLGAGFLTIIKDVQTIFFHKTVTKQSNCTPFYCL